MDGDGPFCLLALFAALFLSERYIVVRVALMVVRF